MREAAIRGFWVSTYALFGYRKVSVQDGAKKRPKLELDSPADAVVRRIFQMALQGKSTLDITKALNSEGIPHLNGQTLVEVHCAPHPLQRSVHRNAGLGHAFKGQCRASAGGQGVPRHRVPCYPIDTKSSGTRGQWDGV